MDGRNTDDLFPTWYGHSIGRWEGDTLVIDTVGYNDKFWFDSRGTPHTDKLHTIERFTRPNFGTLINEFTLDDPGRVFEDRPVEVHREARTQDVELMEDICTRTTGGHRGWLSAEQRIEIGRCRHENEAWHARGVSRHVLFHGAGCRPPRIRHGVRREQEVHFYGRRPESGMQNPHMRVYVDVTDASGKVTTWNMEMTSPNTVRRQGWGPNDLLPGRESHLHNLRRQSHRDTRLSGVDQEGQRWPRAVSWPADRTQAFPSRVRLQADHSSRRLFMRRPLRDLCLMATVLLLTSTAAFAQLSTAQFERPSHR
jgi:hypothetical protein